MTVSGGARRVVGFRGFVARDATYRVVVVHDDGAERVLSQERPDHAPLHSPTGFSWGYGGSGPATLARCILREYLGFEPSRALYQRFKGAVVARWSQDRGWTLSVAELDAWLRATPDEAP